MRFEDLALSAETLAVLRGNGFYDLTPVQERIIPQLCRGQDALVCAVTGSGKTLAFVVPIVEILRKHSASFHPGQVGAIVVAPTRELASQIFDVSRPFFAGLNEFDPVLLVGGADVSLDVSSIENCPRAKVLVGTPGRLLDIMQRCSSHLDFSSLKVLILDEADRLLEMGHDRRVSEIISLLPGQRITGLFSATETKELAVKAGVRQEYSFQTKKQTPSTLSVQSTNSDFSQYLISDADEKSSQLAQFLLEHKSKKTIVYFMTCASVDYWGTILQKVDIMKNVSIVVLHGKMKQKSRENALQRFTDMPSGVLFCTDVAARGLDIPGVDWIVQYDPPQDPNTFVHRVGRTARIGRVGHSVVFLLPKEDTYVEFLRIRNVPVEERNKPEAMDIIPMLRAAAESDRDVMEKGLKAFVSYFRAYKEHHCNYIFQWKKLQLGKIAMGFGLLQLPSMPELKRGIFTSQHFVPVEGIDFSAIKYRDKSREKQRQRELKAAPRKRSKPEKCSKQDKKKIAAVKKLPGKKRSLRDMEELNEDYRQWKKQRQK
ncbi:hypothetical protein SELMODRAFT_103968 [Selaginella moellendorffii]|uniref:ATP-dependent RNA helicase n=1 Tax=Selaginella moellendorffii TaxID=88036 RepID=D8RX15_SELML|nr:hypothetical protein SELMODRAFT_103968 [Selaginella moellendorffii]